jgi:putative RecB family exonuclease
LKEKLNTIEELIDYYNDIWLKHWHDNIKMDPGFKEEHYKKQGERCIRDYYNTYKPFKQGRILGVETEYTFELKKDYWYHVRIDLFLETDKNTYEIHDYKAYSKMPDKAKLEEDRQLALYSLWVRENYKDAHKVRLVWHLVSFDKEMSTEKTTEELAKLKKEVLEVIDQIEKETKFEPTNSRLCDWCEYQQICPAWKHKFKTNGLPANKYLKEEGVVLVNKYAELYAKKKQIEEEIETELEELKEALIAYANKEKIQTIFGSNKKITVKDYLSIKVPAKGTVEREKLEELLNKLKKWKEVSGLDTNALKKAIEDWPSEIKDSVKEFLEVETTQKISLTKNESE